MMTSTIDAVAGQRKGSGTFTVLDPRRHRSPGATAYERATSIYVQMARPVRLGRRRFDKSMQTVLNALVESFRLRPATRAPPPPPQWWAINPRNRPQG